MTSIDVTFTIQFHETLEKCQLIKMLWVSLELKLSFQYYKYIFSQIYNLNLKYWSLYYTGVNEILFLPWNVNLFVLLRHSVHEPKILSKRPLDMDKSLCSLILRHDFPLMIFWSFTVHEELVLFDLASSSCSVPLSVYYGESS